MSQENVELVRRGFDAFARRDIDAILAGLDPDIDVRPAPELPGADSYHGHAGFVAFMERFLESWEEYRLTPERFIDAGDQVVFFTRQSVEEGAAASTSRHASVTSGPCARAEPCDGRCSEHTVSPSKLWGCRSRRCRRRTRRPFSR